ncbi:MAG: hypothetical protein K2X87_15535 [Gemmataceae bacterium]|nr:hypothetical protein [Gemmataceae bacterium]
MTVTWTERALDRYADFYVAAVAPGERDELVRCITEINRRLASDPWFLGESRGPDRRVWFHAPLMVEYVLPPGGGVVVRHVNRTKGGPDAG